MSAFPSTVQSSLGRTFHLAKQIGKGGEGAIYETREQNDVAIKLYWPAKAPSRRDQIAVMASAQWFKDKCVRRVPNRRSVCPERSFRQFCDEKDWGMQASSHVVFAGESKGRI
jgi:hypothetical protein